MFFKNKFLIICLLLLFVSGCTFLEGKGFGFFLDEDDQKIEEQNSSGVPIADGFDYPVGDQNGNGWDVTGYDFLQWSNFSNSWHPGEDWNRPFKGDLDLGQAVYAIGHGIVTFSGWNTAQGNIIQVEHHLQDGTKVWSQYTHLDERWVAKGEIVGRRQQIGTVGKGPGGRFVAHLHFEIRKRELPSNAWPRTNKQPWVKSRVLEYWLRPTEFIEANRPN